MMMEDKMRKIEIFDTTCRDGEQATEGGFKDGVQSKILIAKRLVELGVSTIEAGFPGSSQGDFEAAQMIAREIHGPYVAALAHCERAAIDAAWAAIKDNESPTIHVFTYMIDSKSLDAYGKDVFERDIVRPSFDSVRYAKRLMGGRGRVEFSAQNATLGIPGQVFQVYSAAIEAGADVVNLPDTAGYSYPNEVYAFFSNFLANVPSARNIIISTHCHNDLGNATANTVAAIMAGATQAECTINGIGERAGNASLEEVVMNFRTRKGSDFHVTINTELFGEISRLVSDHSQIGVQQNKAVVGAGAFRHSSGIHQDGVLKGAAYEIMSPGEVGWDGESIEITARS
jgi:2-isopropylmalate synthase